MALLASSASVLRARRAARTLTERRSRPRQSALLVPVPEAGPAVAAWRGGSAAVGAPGLPLHVTLLHPFVPAAAADASVEAAVRAVLAGVAPFRFSLARLERFPGVLYLAPEPAEPFVALTGKLHARWPEHRPYDGAYDSVIPHLTVAFGADAQAPTDGLERLLPIEAAARSLWLMAEGWNGRWSTRARFRLGG